MMTTEGDSNSPAEPLRAMQNELVLQNIFKFVDFKTLKDCRPVSIKWNLISNSSFKKRAKVVCQKSHFSISICFNDFKDIFFRDGSAFPYSSLELVGNLQWKISDLQSFFLNEGKSVIDLKIKDLSLVDDNLQALTSFDVASFITPYLKRVIIENSSLYNDETTNLLNINALASLDYIHLCGCQITLSDNFQISPKEFSIQGSNKYFRNGTELRIREISIWQFVNLERLEKLTFGDGNLSLDLSGTKSLKSLTLIDVDGEEIGNWVTSEWRINRLDVKGFYFQRTRMTISELKIWRNLVVNIALLPTTVEKLILVECEKLVGCGDINLPHLKSLVLRRNEFINFPSCFKSCSTITDIAIYNNHAFRGGKLNVDNLPSNVSKLLTNTHFVSGTRTSQLDTLVLVDYPPGDMDGREMSQLPAKHLIYLNIANPLKFDSAYVQKIITFSENGLCESVTVGPFGWDKASKHNLENSCLRQYVGESEFYTFKAGHVNANSGFFVRENIKSLLPEKEN